MFGVHLRFLRDRVKRKKDNDSDELSLETSNLTPGQIATAQKALRILGLESRLDELKREDCVVFLYAMGLNPTDDIIDSKLRAFKLHHKKFFTFGQLAHVWHSMLQDLTDEDEILKRAFQFFDKDGNGEISVQELRTTMHELGDLLTDEEITSFMTIMDVNNDGAIGYNEFLATLKTQAPNLAGGGSVVPLDSLEALRSLQLQQLQQQEAVATAASLSSATAAPNGTSQPPQAPNVPSTAADQKPGGADGAQKPAASPFGGPAAAPPGPPGGGGGGSCAAGPPGSTSGAVGGGQAGGGPPERTRGPAIARSASASSSSTQLPAFPAWRQSSLKAGLAPPPPAAAAEPLLATDAAAAAPPPPPPLARPTSSNRRLRQSLSASRVASGLGTGSGPAPVPSLERAGSQRRADDTPPPRPVPGGLGSRRGSGSGGEGGDPGQGLRAPSTLEPGSGSGSEGTATT
ncbi:hypothetical protein PLESTB_001795100 [Pleodorina starrii]|uniref:EF-hand domain-containing protein n=1 Tax=Pleodorina starrii TaxID=330485 RepID=A0A9W6C1F2_9CHLO|nr:hypothetical protein PLESTM_001159400 [Pleodorina starrii]GLC61715.1 hypothetical protein PLESTB_001795100 [Pleodorina starrii]